MLLLEAMRYLRLSPAVLRQMLPLAREVQDRLLRFDQENADTTGRLTRVVKRQRDTLAAGRVPGAQEQSDALFLAQTLRGKRVDEEDRLAWSVARRLTRVLSREQVLTAYLLTFGKAPDGVRPSAALLDPASRFALGSHAQKDWRTAVERQTLRQRYPALLVDAVMDPSFPEVNGGLDRENPGPFFGDEQKLANILQQYPAQLRKGAFREWVNLGGRWREFPKLLIEEANEEEQALALQAFTRRMFLSSRLVPVLEERLRIGTGTSK